MPDPSPSTSCPAGRPPTPGALTPQPTPEADPDQPLPATSALRAKTPHPTDLVTAWHPPGRQSHAGKIRHQAEATPEPTPDMDRQPPNLQARRKLTDENAENSCRIEPEPSGKGPAG